MEFKFVLGKNNVNYLESTDEFYLHSIIARINYLDVLLRVRGYVYLNQIYERFDLEWNPANENICFISTEEEPKRFYFSHKRIESGYEITVQYS